MPQGDWRTAGGAALSEAPTFSRMRGSIAERGAMFPIRAENRMTYQLGPFRSEDCLRCFRPAHSLLSGYAFHRAWA